MPQPPPAARRPARSLNADGFAALFVENYPLAVRYAARFTHDRTRAEDVAAEAFLRGWRNRHRLRAVEEARAWLLSITHNCAISQLRLDRREIVDSERVRAQATLTTDDPGPAVDAPARTALHRAVARLSPDQRRVLELRFFDGWPPARIATLLGRDARAVRSLQYCALQRRRAQLQPPDPGGGGEPLRNIAPGPMITLPGRPSTAGLDPEGRVMTPNDLRPCPNALTPPCRAPARRRRPTRPM